MSLKHKCAMIVRLPITYFWQPVFDGCRENRKDTGQKEVQAYNSE